MSEVMMPGSGGETLHIRDTTCIHTSKIYDSCQSRDCLEDLRVFLTTSGQQLLDCAQSVQAGRAELLHVSVRVDPVGFHRGYFTVDLRYFYRITAEVISSDACRTQQICGLTYFDKRCVLFGSQGTAKIFSSQQGCLGQSGAVTGQTNLPTAVVEAVDPIVLGLKLTDVCSHPHRCCEAALGEMPNAILERFGEPIHFDPTSQRRLLVTLGQFSILRMERDSQLLIPICDYCMPDKECCCDGPAEDDPCSLFQRVDFPVDEFFPPVSVEPADPCTLLKKNCGCN